MDLAQRPVDLALALTRAGATLVVVGGTARRLRGSGTDRATSTSWWLQRTSPGWSTPSVA